MSGKYSDRIRIRPFQSGDLEPIVELWNRCLAKDPVDVERFWRLVLLDPNFDCDSTLVAEANGEPLGFVQGITRRVPLGIHPIASELGWITMFFVAPEVRRRGVGRALFEAAISALKGRGCVRVSCNGYAPAYFFPGVDVDYVEAGHFMLSMGFRDLTEAVAMSLPLRDVTTPSEVAERRRQLLQQGLEVRSFEYRDTVPLLRLAEDHFPYWHQSIVDGLQQDLGNVFVARRADEILAFAQWQNPQTDPPSGAPGRFGPFGVRPDQRGNGLGAVLFYTLIENLPGDRPEELWFGWAGGRNLSFYQRAGCKVTRQYRLLTLDC